MHDATVATEAATRAPLPLRHDTILGVCQGIGEEFGFNPDWLRVALASIVLFNPLLAVTTYAVLGLLVAASRLLFPARAAAAPSAAHAAPVAANEQEALPAAA